MSNVEPEYEVESIIEARVETVGAKRSRKSKLVMKYRVRWKGYKPEDDTWEPIESFDGSQEMVDNFWARASSGGRDYRNLSLFTDGERFIPLGPPRKVKRPKTNVLTKVDATEEKDLIPKRSSKTIEPAPRPTRGSKRPRSESTSKPPPSMSSPSKPSTSKNGKTVVTSPSTDLPSRKKMRRSPSVEIVPDSDEEMETAAALLGYPNFTSMPPGLGLVTPQLKLDAQPLPQETPVPPAISDLLSDARTQESVQLASPETRPQSRTPRVKMVPHDDPELATITDTRSAKAKAIIRTERSPEQPVQRPAKPSTRPKPGPGRSSVGMKYTSSLLTSHRGKLQTIKGKYAKPVSRSAKEGADSVGGGQPMAVEKPPPTAEELLDLAGLGTNDAEPLPDFEEDGPTIADAMPDAGPSEMDQNVERTKSDQEARVDYAKNQLFPDEAVSTVSTNIFGDWGRSTIFGPLGLGCDSSSKSEQSKFSQIHLYLDNSISVPIQFHNISGAFHIIKVGGSIPGKFYSVKAANVLLNTLRASGDSAMASLNDTASEEEARHYQMFAKRLLDGDIFVTASGMDLLVFCTTNNTLLSQRLNIPTALLNQEGPVVVSKVDIENYTGYADATAGADDRRWTEYTNSC